MSNISVKYWKDGKHILVESEGWDCFIRNEALNPMINWINLHRNDIKNGKPCKYEDYINDIDYTSVGGNLMIRTHRDLVFLSKENFKQFAQWLNEHREILNIGEIVVS